MSVSDQPIAAVNSRDAFEEFVRDRSRHLFRLALALSGWDEATADDLLQVALERAYRRRWVLFRDGAVAEPYVRRVLVNAAIDWRRGRRRSDEQLLMANPADLTVPDRSAEIADRDLLMRALRSLPPRQRAVLVMRYWEDLPDAQIAAVMNCSTVTVRTQASRALARLREQTGSPSARNI